MISFHLPRFLLEIQLILLYFKLKSYSFMQRQQKQSSQLQQALQIPAIPITSQFQTVTSQQHMYKIFGKQKFTFESAYAPSVVDWSGFYTQLTPQHSMRYLTKKWDDGATEACLLVLRPVKEIKILKIKGKQLLSSQKVSGHEKARLIKQHIHYQGQLAQKIKSQSENFYFNFNFNPISENNKDQFQSPDSPKPQPKLLLKQMGNHSTLIECIDSEQPQIIVPHEMLNQQNFEFRELLQFKKSKDGMLRTIGWKWSSNKQKQVQESWQPVTGECQFQPYLILQQIAQISKKKQEFDQKLWDRN